jgi:regulator of protease activity HflC (stomatin/prohibitin superfamily)
MSNIFPRTGNANRGGPSESGGGFRSFLSIPIIVIGVLLVIVWLAWPFRTIDQGEVGVKLRWGQAVAVLQPGFNVVIPGMEHVVLLSTRTLKRTYEKVNTYSRDIQQADNLISVNYRIDPSKAIDIYSRYGESYAASIIDPVIYKRFKEVFGGYDAADIVNQRAKLGKEVELSIQQNMPPGIVIVGVQIENIDFAPTYVEAIEAAATAEAAVRKARQELEQKKVDAEKVVVQANADAEARIAQAKAEAEAIRLRGEAEGAAITAKAAALRDNPGYVALTAAEKWDGKLPQTMVPGSAVPFVTVPRGATQQ